MAKETKKEKSIFDEFTNQYSLLKTLRFRLRPIWNTQQMLDDERVVQNDELRRKKYDAVKPWFDKLHGEFIQEALSNFKFSDLRSYKSALDELRKDRKSTEKKVALTKKEASLREEIVRRFDKTANDWSKNSRYEKLGLKKSGIGMLFEAGVFELLKKRFEGAEGTVVDGLNIFGDWDKWSGYFKKFFETRKNFYKQDDTSTAVAYRMVNQNLRRFCENIHAFQEIRKKVDISEINANFKVSCADMFSLENYSRCLLQDGIDLYNKIIGRELRGKDEEIKGINELVNKYRQDNKDEKLYFLKPLDKQILSEKEAFILSIENDTDLLSKLKDFYQNAESRVTLFRKLIADIAQNHSPYDLSKIYLSKETLEHNASRWFMSYESFERGLFAVVAERENKQNYESMRTHKDDSKINDKDGKLSFPDFIKCSDIKEGLTKQEGRLWKEKYYEDIPGLEKESDKFKQLLYVIQFELEQQCLRKVTDKETGKQAEVGYDIFKKPIAGLIFQDVPIDSKAKINIKNFADATLSIYQMAKYFAVEKRRQWLDQYDLDERFYKSTDIGYYTNFYLDAFEQLVRPYNLFRNYLTKKPYSTGKWLLSFENKTLADGWDKNKETANGAIILRKDGRYYLGIMKEGCKGLFTDKYKKEIATDVQSGAYEKMVYKQVADASKDIHNLVLMPNGKAVRFTKMENKQKYWPAEITKIKEKKSYAKESFDRHDFEVFVEYMKKCAISYWSDFSFNFSPTKDYKNIKSFTDEIEKSGYKISFASISEPYIKEKNEEGELFIFEIHNKDWNLKEGKPKTGTKNLQTLYFEELFSKENEQTNFPFKLNGEAELFFRPKTEEEKLGYKVWDTKVKRWTKIDKKEKGALVDRRRYAEDTILFHCPITLNRVSENKTKSDIDTDVRKMVASDSSNICIIGIDRGEKHLAYYSVVDQSGKILETDTLNAIGRDGAGKPVKYAAKLDRKMQEREASRRDWTDIEAIKDLKQGYISQIVRKIADLIIKYKAIIILEDLSTRFKQVRSGIEKSVYQQLEKALIDKLSFLVRKGEKDIKQAGHILRAYQLSAPVAAFRDMGKQTGIIFYTQAGYTSKTCPECGYRRNIKCRFESIAQAKKLIEKLEVVNYDAKADAFTLRYSLKKLFDLSQDEERRLSNELHVKIPRKDIFTLSTKNALRYKWYSRYSEKVDVHKLGVSEYKGEVQESETKTGIIKEFNLTEYIKSLLEIVRIDYKNRDIKKQILSTVSEKGFYEDFLFALFLLTETRHSISGTDTDYIQCPECEFDSRKGFQGVKEFNGDANGAYNIARKGIVVLDKIRQFGKHTNLAKMSWGDLSISIQEWDKFTQNK